MSKSDFTIPTKENRSIHFHLGRLEMAITFMERELKSLKEIHEDMTELAKQETLKNIRHETIRQD